MKFAIELSHQPPLSLNVKCGTSGKKEKKQCELSCENGRFGHNGKKRIKMSCKCSRLGNLYTSFGMIR